jgi:hypothetical protein
MDDVRAWLVDHVRDLAISAAVALAVATVLLWLRRAVTRRLGWLPATAGWATMTSALRPALRFTPVWIALISALAAVQFLPIRSAPREAVSHALVTILVLAIGIATIRFGRDLVRMIGERVAFPSQALRAGAVGLAIVFGGAVALVLLQIWGVPTAPLLFLLVLLGVLALVALRDLLPEWVAALQVNALDGIRVGDYVELESGDSGTVEELRWRDASLRGVDGRRVRVPHSRLVRSTVAHRRPSEARAGRPLRFVQRSHLRELTGLRARNLRELLACLREAPDSAIYYHTHQYLEEHQYLVPSPANGLAEWVTHALGLDAVGEALGAVNVLDMSSLRAVRERLAEILESAIAEEADGRVAAPGREFHFIRSVTVVTPCPYQASTLAELAGVVRRLSHGSLFFHLFEARLLGGIEAERDICNWLRRELHEPELAAEIGQFNPYDFTFDGLRETLLARLEGRL